MNYENSPFRRQDPVEAMAETAVSLDEQYDLEGLPAAIQQYGDAHRALMEHKQDAADYKHEIRDAQLEHLREQLGKSASGAGHAAEAAGEGVVDFVLDTAYKVGGATEDALYGAGSAAGDGLRGVGNLAGDAVVGTVDTFYDAKEARRERKQQTAS